MCSSDLTVCNAYTCDMQAYTQLLKLIEAAQLSLVGDCIEVCRSPMLMQQVPRFMMSRQHWIKRVVPLKASSRGITERYKC